MGEDEADEMNKVHYVLMSALSVNGQRRPIIEWSEVADSDGRIPESIAAAAAARIQAGEATASQMVLLAIPLDGTEEMGHLRVTSVETATVVSFTRVA